jgi:hypothetical protein
MNEVVIPLKIQGIAQMKAELRELKGELANATDPAQMTALAQKAGVLTDKIKDANEAVKVFASGSKFEQVSNGLGGIKSSLMSLDFEEAAEKSKVFATALGGINKADISKSLKGAMDMTKTLGSAFLKLGVQILMNPIFLLVTVIAGVVVAVGMFLNKLGVLTAVMEAIKAPFKAVVQGFKDLTDWMGLTDNAAEENARVARENAMAHVAANNKIMASSKERQDLQTAQYNREIAESKARGENTYQLEYSQTAAIQNASHERIKIANESIKKLDGLNDAASVNKHNKLIEEINKELEINKNAISAKEVLAINEGKRISDEKDKAEKIAADKAKAARDKRIAADKASQVEIDAAAKIVSDSKKTAQQIEIDDLVASYKKKIAEANKHKNDTTALLDAQAIQVFEINKKYTDQATANQLALDATNLANLQAFEAKQLEIKKEAKEKEVEAAEYAKNLMIKIDQERLQQKKLIEDAAINLASSSVNFLQSIAGKNKGIQKAAIIAENAVAIAKMVMANNAANAGALATPQAIATSGAAAIPVIAMNNISTALGIAATIAATSKALSAVGGGSVSAPSNTNGGGGTSTTAVAPVSGPSLFGNANTGSQVNAGGGTGNNITVTAIVSETEITASQNHINNIQQNSVL